MKLQLLNYWRSSASYRVRIALGLKRLPYEYVAVNILTEATKTPEYKARNPMAQVPTLVVTEDDGTIRHLTQSLAILEYLEDRWQEAPLLPRDPFLRAKARSLAEVVNSGIQPLQNHSTTRRVAAMGGDDKAWVKSFIADGLAALEHQVQETAGRFSVGDTPSIADCLLVPQLYSARRFGVPPEQFPFLCLIEKACNELPAFTDAHPDKQPDAAAS